MVDSVSDAGISLSQFFDVRFAVEQLVPSLSDNNLSNKTTFSETKPIMIARLLHSCFMIWKNASNFVWKHKTADIRHMPPVVTYDIK